MSEHLDPWLTAKKVAELLDFSEDWVLEKAAEGVLPSYQVGVNRRFLLSEIEGWRASRKFSVEGAEVVRLHRAGTEA